MESIYSALTQRAFEIRDKAQHNGSSSSRAVIALAGPPGSGKSTVAAEVTSRINKNVGRRVAAVLPMDGFHYSRAHLDTLPNREEAHRRRGVAWTFDAQGVVALVKLLHSTKLDTMAIRAPGFDHETKDPIADAHTIGPEIEVVIIEGTWLLYDLEPWSMVSTLVDDTWFIDVDPSLALYRVAHRHLKSGIESSLEAALVRAEENDLANGEEIRKHLIRPGIRVESVEH
ncbi:putative uridine kinase [Paramyrothecium foliicola]|nr:putative uridine kinase [Paramyrothecium foliicola]